LLVIPRPVFPTPPGHNGLDHWTPARQERRLIRIFFQVEEEAEEEVLDWVMALWTDVENGVPQRRCFGDIRHEGHGFVWHDTTYSSLSTIARTITGTAWNGPRFFGLRAGRQADQESEADLRTAKGTPAPDRPPRSPRPRHRLTDREVRR
jgi:hypothetical protein